MLKMPLTKRGEKVLGAMRDTYGKEKGESVFYAMENKERTEMNMNGKKPAMPGAKGKAVSAAAKAGGKAYGQAMAASKKPVGMAMGGVATAAKAGGKAYGTGVAEGKQRMGIGMAKGGMAKKKAKK
jgi:hypothetical protein